MNILGISAYFHDAAAALVVDGEVIAAASEERFTRKKHDADTPLHAIEFCLEQGGITIDDVDHVVFYEQPLLKFERIIVNHLREFPRGLGQFSRAMAAWLGRRLWMKNELSQKIGFPLEKLTCTSHHMSHAASAFLTSPFDEAAVVTIDGVGEWATTSIFHGRTVGGRTSLDLVSELHFPHSIGLLYSALTAYLGFRVNAGEYKVMGLAPFGCPRFLGAFDELASIGDDGSLVLNRDYFAFQYHREKSFSPRLEELLGPARVPETELHLGTKARHCAESQRMADVAASLQAFTERYLLTLVRQAAKVTGATNLCMAGGVALNSVANHKIANEGSFESVLVHPAAGDAGGAVGAALYFSNIVQQQPRHQLDHAYLGKGYSQGEVCEFLDACQVSHQVYGTNEDDLFDVVADKLERGQVGGWFSGRFEWGPRALGNRSILADPRHDDTRDRVNSKIKFREEFRPFAPSVLEEDFDQWFHSAENRDEHLIKTMCGVVPTTERARAEIPAVVHVDGTSRVQSVSHDVNRPFHRLLRAFKKRSGIGVLLNTSMNLRGEPICNSPADAYGMFLRSDLDFLVIEGCLIQRRPQ